MKPAFSLAVLLFTSWAPLVAAERPNVVYLLADDLGWSDLSAHPGGSIPTPNIDRLFRQGVELSNFMGWCVCSPTRAMLLTGRHPFRVGTGPETGGELASGETTIAEAFRANGYRTGVFGKWHNGGDPDTPEYRRAFEEAWKSMPNKRLNGGLGVGEHGFDEAWVYYGGGADYFTRRTVQGRGPVSWWHNREFRPQDEGYTEDFITQHALEFIRGNKDRPFFCYVPFHIVHAPLQAKEEDLKDVDPKVTDKTKRTYAAMVQAMDNNVAAILAELDELGLCDDTIVVFTSDNGATMDGSNLPLRGGKHSIYEGGVRLPTVIRWPKGGLATGRWNGLCGSLDMLPTLMAMTGGTMPATRPLDGKNLWPALWDGGPSPVESYYWVWHGEDALRTAEWKLHRFSDRFELYDVGEDEGETTNVADVHPDVVKELTAKMDAWADSLGAALTHRAAPAKYDAQPAPEGDVLEVTVTVTDKAKPKDRMIVPFAGWGGFQEATDWVEFDICFAPDSLPHGCFYSPVQGNAKKPYKVFFKRGDGVDQFGREQAAGPETKVPQGEWEHRVIGLCSFAPGPLGQHALVFTGDKAGTFRVYLDNLRIRHADGSVSSLWTDAKHTRFPKNRACPAGFRDVSVRAVARTSIAAIGILSSGAFAVESPAGAMRQKAREILDATGVTGGLVVLVGCGDGRLAAALHAGDGFLVQAIDTDAVSVEAARRNIQSLGLYGAVTVDRFDGRHLPYVDNLARLLVSDNLGGVPEDEVLRVLAPLGVAYVRQDDEWRKIVKPWPKEIDQWTHYLHDAGNNAVAHDSVVASPKGLQWSAGPRYCRSHEYDSSISAQVSAGGRVFYILDDGPIGVVDKRLPQKWSLYARDAFNGVLYTSPHQCICFSGVLLSGFNTLTPRSAAEATAPAEQPRLAEGPAFGEAVAPEGNGGEDWPMFRAGPTRSGSVRTTAPRALSQVWQTKLQGKLTQPVVSGGRLFVCEKETDRALCLDCKDGRLLWSATAGGRVDSPPAIHRGLVIFGSTDGWVYSLRASDGVLAWRYRVTPAQRRVVSTGRVESVWPVHGAVLMQNGSGEGAQMLVFDAQTAYSAHVYTKRVGRSPVYFPGEEYVHLSANPIGQRTRSRNRKKGAANDGPGWSETVPIFVRAMALAGNTLLVSGMPDRIDTKDPLAALEGRAGGVLWAVSAHDGKKLAESRLDAPPVFDSLIAAGGRLYLALTDSRVICLGAK